MTSRRIIHSCTTRCTHGGPVKVRWPWKTEGSILEDWPGTEQAEKENKMPISVMVSMGASVQLLEGQP
jgi:hypothetical protein